MEHFHSENTDKLFEAILTLKSVDECYKLFEDLCTIKEIQDMAQRFEVARMLSDNKVYNLIASETGASTATISRVNKALVYGKDGYKLAISRLKK